MAPTTRQVAGSSENEGGYVAAPMPRSHHINLPMFDSEEPHTWFCLADAVLAGAGIVDSTEKLFKLMVAVGPLGTTVIKDILNDIGTIDDPYAAAKERLCRTFQRSAIDRCNAIIDYPSLGAKKPSVLMNEMLALLPHDEKPGHLFTTHFLRRLPQNMREHLAMKTFAGPREMAEQADLIFHVQAAAPVVAAAGTVKNNSKNKKNANRRRHSPSPNRGGRKQTPGPGRDHLCYTHARFGVKAFECSDPKFCTFSEN
jgi:hypothetical protein